MTSPLAQKTAYLSFCGLIDSQSVTKIAATLNAAVNGDFERVHMTITSVGGFVSDGIFLYNHIRALPKPITLHNTGLMASIAATLFLASDERVCSPNAVFMMHPVALSAPGAMGAQALQANLSAALADEERIDAILRERANLSDANFTQRRLTELYITAEEALSLGLVHRVEVFRVPPGNQIIQL